MNEKNENETTHACACARVLLDSSLKSQYEHNFVRHTNRMIYNVKIIKCGDYIQMYKFANDKSKNDNNWDDNRISKINIKNIDTDNLYKNNELKSILLSNAIRSNLNCQRLCKANKDSWETFITLTFSNNITDLSYANKKFSSWISNVRKLKKDFKYIAVPEFQKRGAVHYHILSNLGSNDTKIIYLQKVKKGNAKKCDQLYDVKYWPHGYARVDFVKSDYKKIYSYICKYMTKDIDNKLFGKKRYFFSQNLIKPKEEYLDLANEKDYNYFLSLLQDKNIQYENTYEDNYSKCKINFIEYIKKE